VIIGDVEFAIDVEHRKFETRLLDFDRAAGGNVGRAAELDMRSAGVMRCRIGHVPSGMKASGTN
jgi:hypothetical protein